MTSLFCKPWVLTAVLLAVCVQARAETAAALPASVQEALKAARLPSDALSVVVLPVQSGSPRLQHQAGVQRKWLGSYTERQINCLVWKIEPGAKLKIDAYPAPQVLFVIKGSVSVNGKQYGLHTAFGLEPGEALPEMTGVTETEVLMYQLPRFTAQEHDEYRRSMQDARGSKLAA